MATTQQEGSLCAQHCLNNLLQGEYFSPVELSSIAHQLDEEERMRMAEGGVTSEDYRTFLQQPSGNMDDSGFFSIQVSSHKHVLSVVYIPGSEFRVCDVMERMKLPSGICKESCLDAK
ncbi:hypothetical protein Celaphus_00015486 [Cervus elaphus hippelaphus]|uniref:ubiquitinyl hydrolase 1 n=1 Tax=Cervus elaphus hippelaphus TaxID=46360 RepID=A0A212CS48_CEREH|nr:hypothetical protein Celaphus_00015486 [Cervus elaphus hippelaphus]